MTLTLMLLRHAKSGWDDPSLEDIARPLAPRGIKAAPQIAAYVAASGLTPDLVLCSSAVRTRETLALMLPHWQAQCPRVVYEETLYLAAASEIIDRVRAVPDGPRRVMVVGHNPGMHSAAMTLVGSGRRPDITALASKFPTAALAVLTFDRSRWSDVRPTTGHLDRYVTSQTVPPPVP